MICHHGFDRDSENTSHIALRCLCNILLRSEAARQIFVDQGYEIMAMDLMRVGITYFYKRVRSGVTYFRMTILRVSFFRQDYYFCVHMGQIYSQIPCLKKVVLLILSTRCVRFEMRPRILGLMWILEFVSARKSHYRYATFC